MRFFCCCGQWDGDQSVKRRIQLFVLADNTIYLQTYAKTVVCGRGYADVLGQIPFGTDIELTFYAGNEVHFGIAFIKLHATAEAKVQQVFRPVVGTTGAHYGFWSILTHTHVRHTGHTARQETTVLRSTVLLNGGELLEDVVDIRNGL